MEELIEKNDQLDISKINGRTQIIFKKAIIKGKVSQAEVLNTLLVAAKMQAEYYIQKLSRGSPLDSSEVKSLKELAEITKLEAIEIKDIQQPKETLSMQDIKAKLYLAITEKSKSE